MPPSLPSLSPSFPFSAHARRRIEFKKAVHCPYQPIYDRRFSFYCLLPPFRNRRQFPIGQGALLRQIRQSLFAFYQIDFFFERMTDGICRALIYTSQAGVAFFLIDNSLIVYHGYGLDRTDRNAQRTPFAFFSFYKYRHFFIPK